MIEAILRLEFCKQADRPTTCWYVASRDARDWVEAAVHGFFPGNQLAIRILPVPRSSSQREPIGAVILGPHIVHNNCPKRCVRYSHLTEGLIVPAESRLTPEVTLAELEELLPNVRQHVLHPQAGLIAFEPSDLLSLADLIQHLPADRKDFTRGVPGARLPTRLTSIYPAIPPSMQIVLSQGQDGIGTKGQNGDKIPAPEGEPKPGVGNAMGRVGLSVFSAGLNMASAAGEFIGRHITSVGSGVGGQGPSRMPDSGGNNWLDQLKEWTQRRLAHLNETVLSEREKEINRLMNLLDMNPDEGLKWALPIGGEAHRGMAAPSGHLSQRNPSFNLGNVGGGGPADHWHLSYQRQQELIQKYRELANREISLGRYRRAAYIFAELLADVGAAADVLKQGNHWREAATLYKDKLNNPRAAALCLEEGRFWTEAIELYLELREYAKSGDLHRQLDQNEEATKCYEIAVSECLERRDFLAAAGLLENKLADVPRAIASLEDGWPHSNQATACLRELFSVYQRHGMHEAAKETIEHVCVGFSPSQNQVALVETLSENAICYPDRGVKHSAADATRVVASRLLIHPRTIDKSRILQAIKRLDPDDRLLARDCLRFGQQEKKDDLPKAASRSRRAVRVCFERMIDLQHATPECESIASAVSANVIIQAVQNQASGHLRIFRLAWEDGSQTMKQWKNAPVRPAYFSTLAVDPNRPNRVYFNMFQCPSIIPVTVTFSQEDRIPFETTLTSLSADTLGVSLTSQGIRWLVQRTEAGFTLTAWDQNGRLVSTVSLAEYVQQLLPLIETPVGNIPMHATARYVYLGLGNELVIHDYHATRTMTLEQPIHRLVGSYPNTRPRLLVSLQQGARIYWDDYFDGREFNFATELSSPYLAFTRGGNVIAGSERTCQIYSTRNSKMEIVGELQVGATIRGVITGNAPEQFGVVQQDGRIAIYSWTGQG